MRKVTDGDKETFRALLNGGMDPNIELPFPVPEAFQQRFGQSFIRYYLAKEPGFTALMLSVSMGNHLFARFLLAAGANPQKVTKRARVFPLWIAADRNDLEMMRLLMGIGPEHEANRVRIAVKLKAQRAEFWRNGQKEFETPVSSGNEAHPTPRGKFLVTDKYVKWKSTLYHAQMPLFMRLSCADFGLHVGRLPGYPASHGCIRVPESAAKKLFAAAPVGTLVEID